ncbi:hypothetical protein DFH08DRAFT_811230 [Mycena albidolilacea]|uniref:DUF6535 domain-containing protein n=1 Tax=Mycena albidolilacea TaxID=1033008 RepID=A0AAD6ZWI8_9AGAR|nr:hypothetical protein DFH08DRAFT_811230 [Mycena albidolilacea]
MLHSRMFPRLKRRNETAIVEIQQERNVVGTHYGTSRKHIKSKSAIKSKSKTTTGVTLSSPTRDVPMSPPTTSSARDAAIGNHPDTRSSGIHDPFPCTHFGLKQSEQKVHRSPTDYRTKYAEDPPYKELDDEARVWGMFTMTKADLFSNVLTTFVAQTSQALSPDNTAVSNSILLELFSLQHAQANGTSFKSIPHADILFTVALSDVWVNGLWFTSLMLSLTTALLAVLAKQWLRQYSSFIAGSARERAMIRQFRYTSLEKWVIGCPYRTPLTPLLYSFLSGLARDLYILGYRALTFVGLLRRRSLRFRQFDKFLRQAEHVYVDRRKNLWIHSALSWLASTTSDPSAKLILVEALGLVHLH